MKIINSLSHREQEPEKSVLYIVGTPIGNLYDVSFRAINILKNVSFIACEDTRQTQKIMNKFDIQNKLISFNMHNSFEKIPSIISSLKEGKSGALVSDAGLPSICDPGEDLIDKVRISNLDVICIPGPCAALTALVSSGFPSSKFVFEGFLPKKQTEREKILRGIGSSEKTVIIYESPHRLHKLLEELKNFCGRNREILITRELTKKFEQHIRSNKDKALEIFEGKKVMGEFTIVIKGIKKKSKEKVNLSDLKNELHELINAGLSLTAASKYLSKKESIKKNLIYDLYFK